MVMGPTIALHAHVSHRGGVLADEDSREARPSASIAQKLPGTVGSSILDLQRPGEPSSEWQGPKHLLLWLSWSSTTSCRYGIVCITRPLEEAARHDPKVAPQLLGRTVRKVVVVPGRLVSFVVDRGLSLSQHARRAQPLPTA
jgi:hypothetical protein